MPHFFLLLAAVKLFFSISKVTEVQAEQYNKWCSALKSILPDDACNNFR